MVQKLQHGILHLLGLNNMGMDKHHVVGDLRPQVFAIASPLQEFDSHSTVSTTMNGLDLSCRAGPFNKTKFQKLQ